MFSVSQYAATGLSITTAATAAIILTIGVFVFARSLQTPAANRFLVWSVMAGTWLAALALAYSARVEESALFWARLSQLPLALLPAAGLALAATVSHRPLRETRAAVTLGWIACAAAGVVAWVTPLVVTGVTKRPWGHQPLAGDGFIATALVAAVVYGTTIFLLVETFRRREGETSDRAGVLLIAFLLAAPAFLDLLPAYGIEVYPIGYIATFALAAVAGAAIAQFGSFELTPQFAASQILETMKSAVILVDMTGKIRVVNQGATALLGYSAQDLIGQPMRSIFGEDEYSSTRRILNSTGVLEQVMGWQTAAGAKIDVLTSSSFIRASDGAPIGVVYVASDYTERKRAEQALRESAARYRLLFERNLAGVYRTTVDGRVLDCNEAFARMFGYDTRDEMIREGAQSLYFSPDERTAIITQLQAQRSITNHEAKMRRRDEQPIWVLENMTLLDGATGEAGVIEGTVIDVTDRKLAQERVEYQAWHDVLTSLPNRVLFRDRLGLALAHARRSSRMLAVMYLDLDGFKAVNDKLGHNVGDRLLQTVAVRLVECVRGEDTVARIGGDEFTILLPDLGDARGAATVAQKVIETLANPMVIDGHALHVTPSIGIALFPGDGFDAEALLKSADYAMYRAKHLGRNNYQYATPPPFDDRAALQRRLDEAFRNHEFVLHYQPIVDAATEEIRAVEALLRWNDPRGGLQRPASFIGAIEDSALMFPLGEWVLRTASAKVREWREARPDLRLCVNLFARQFQERDLVPLVARILESSGLPADALSVEITEAAAMNNPEVSLVAMEELRKIGVAVMIDDFGSGYSSFRYLRRLPIDAVKIDQEFVRGVTGDESDRAAVTALVSMARSLGISVIAEGVETREELALLIERGCGATQGHLHAEPMPAEAFESLLGLRGATRVSLGTPPDA